MATVSLNEEIVKDCAQFLNPSEAARQLGVSTKALRLYEQRGLLIPLRTEAGWRTYGPQQMARAAEIADLRTLGFSLAQVARVLDGDTQGLESALAEHQTLLEERARNLSETITRVRDLRVGLAQGQTPTAKELGQLLQPTIEMKVAFDLPWPWGGERFELRDIRPLNYIIGPLGSGKTQLAKRLAEKLPDAAFLGLDRLESHSTKALAQLDADTVLRSRVDKALAWLVEDGAEASEALVGLLVGLESTGAAVLIVDMVEQGLNHATQEALIAYLRRRGHGCRTLFLLTRSNAILNLPSVGSDEAIILCPANHNSPTRVAPYPGAPGYEAVATCLASPEVRARMEGVVAWRPPAA
jgi:DNA-binding transcriptional MerR regulator